MNEPFDTAEDVLEAINRDLEIANEVCKSPKDWSVIGGAVALAVAAVHAGFDEEFMRGLQDIASRHWKLYQERQDGQV